jgi:hypothetical protein
MSRKKNSKKEKVTEYFEVEKKGKEKIVKSSGFEKVPEEKPGKKQILEENKILLGVLASIAVLSLVLIGAYFFFQNAGKFDYRGVEFEIVDEIAPYRTSLPVVYNGERMLYNFYLRNNPRDLENVPFNGEIVLAQLMVINATEDLNCDGYGTIGIANLNNLYKIIGVNVIKDSEASCDNSGEYMFLNIKDGEETKVEQVGEMCYEITANNCEILEATERFMVETLIKVNKELV